MQLPPSRGLSQGCKSSLRIRGWFVLFFSGNWLCCAEVAIRLQLRFSWRFSVSQCEDLFSRSKLYKNIEALYTIIIILKVLEFLHLIFFSLFCLLFTAQAGDDRYLLKTSWEMWGLKYSAYEMLLSVFPVVKYTRMTQSWNAVFIFEAGFIYLLSHFKPAFSHFFSCAILYAKCLNIEGSDLSKQRCRHWI